MILLIKPIKKYSIFIAKFPENGIIFFVIKTENNDNRAMHNK